MRATVANQYLTHPFRTVSERLSEKGKRSLPCSLTEHQNGTFRPIFASQHVQIRAQSVVRTPFRTVSLAGLWPFVSERVGYARHRNPPKRGDRDAYPTSRDDTGFDPLRATFLKARL